MFITDRGRPAHVLLSIEEHRRLLGEGTSLLDAVAQADGGDLDFTPPKINGPLSLPVDLL